MILKIKHIGGYYVNANFIDFKTEPGQVTIYSPSAKEGGEPVKNVIPGWEEIYILDGYGNTIDTIKR